MSSRSDPVSRRPDLSVKIGVMAEERQGRPPMGSPEYLPDHARERRAEFLRSTPSERLDEAIRLSRTATKLTVAGAAAKKRR